MRPRRDDQLSARRLGRAAALSAWCRRHRRLGTVDGHARRKLRSDRSGSPRLGPLRHAGLVRQRPRSGVFLSRLHGRAGTAAGQHCRQFDRRLDRVRDRDPQHRPLEDDHAGRSGRLARQGRSALRHLPRVTRSPHARALLRSDDRRAIARGAARRRRDRSTPAQPLCQCASVGNRDCTIRTWRSGCTASTFPPSSSGVRTTASFRSRCRPSSCGSSRARKRRRSPSVAICRTKNAWRRSPISSTVSIAGVREFSHSTRCRTRNSIRPSPASTKPRAVRFPTPTSTARRATSSTTVFSTNSSSRMRAASTAYASTSTIRTATA